MARKYTIKTKEDAERYKKLHDQANDAFHNGDSIMLDGDYDALRDALLPWYPDLENQVGAPVPKSASARMTALPNFMASLHKIKPPEFADKNKLRDFHTRLGPPTEEKVVMTKVDGSSVQIVNRKGRKSMYSRGDGTTGQDISYLIPHLRMGECPDGYDIRFEVVLTIKAFAKVQALVPHKNYTAPRNVASSAIVNATRADPRIAGLASCIAFTIYKPRMTPQAALQKLRELGWLVPRWRMVADVSVTALTALLQEWKAAVPYEMDGLVLARNVYEAPGLPKPANAIAFKIDDPPTIVTVKKVVWEPSQYGLLNPVAYFDPIKVSGVSVTKCTLHDARNVLRKRIGPGARIGVIRSGDVIPKIVSVKRPAKQAALPPKGTYTWVVDKKGNRGANILSTDPQHLQQIAATRRVAFFSSIGVLGFGDAVASKLHDVPITTICRMTPAELRAKGLGQADSVKLPQAIRTALQSTTVPRLMAASSVFGSGFGIEKANTAWAAINGNPPKKRTELAARIAALHGFSDESAQSFADRWADWLKFYKSLPYRPKTTANSTALVGKVFAFSEFRDKLLENYIQSHGGQVKGSVTKDTTALFAAPTCDSTKARRAKALIAQGVKVQIVPPSQAREFVGFKQP